MPTLFSFFLSLSFSLLCAESAVVFSPPTRRLLHQPFVPLDSLSPSEPPSPSSNPNPKYPFSDTSPPSPPSPTDSPFFPAVAAPPPPPPPSPETFASFPANISSLIVPRSEPEKRGSNKLVALSIAAVVSGLAVLAVAVFFFYYKSRASRRELSDDKTFRSESSSRFFSAVGGGNAVSSSERPPPRAQKLRAGPASGGASSEFLYLGTLVDSRRIEEVVDSSRGERLDARKMESPELHPLPPLLARRSSGVSGNGGGAGNVTDVNSTADEEEEEFYSPRGSIGTGSGSRRVFAAVPEGENGPTSSPSPSSSPASSPYRTESMSYSPPVIFGSTRPEPKMSPPPPPPPPQRQPHYATSSPASSSSSPSPERVAEKSSSFTDQIQSARSPSLSPISSSPERALNAAKEKLSSLSSASSSPERVSEMKSLAASLNKLSPSPTLSAPSSTRESPARASNASAKKWQILSPERDLEENSDETSSLSNDSVPLSFEFDPHRRSLSPSPSPERVAEKIRDSPPRVSAASESDRKRLSPSPSLSSSASSSPARVYSPPNASDQKAHLLSPEMEPIKNKDESPRVSNASEGILFELDPKNRSRSLSPPIFSPERDFHNNSDASQRTSEDSDRSQESPIRDSNQNLTIPTPPPLPPPPPALFLKQWKGHSPRFITSTAKPPALIPPSRPFVIPSPADLSVSLVELPPPGSTSPEAAEDAPKPKLKPLHWDKVRASSDREMVWDQLRTSSFKLNEEMIETLFVVKTPNAKPKETTPRSVIPSPNTENRVLDPKKSQNIAISLRALNVTIEEVCEALLEGNAEALGNELLESLLKMAPTKEEERKLKEYKDDSPVKLGPAERFLKAVLDVPFAFKRVDAMLYIANFDSEVDYLKRSFATLEGACEELRNSRMFMKLLEAVLKTGNRMNVGTNRGDAHAFKLDTLLKLVDVKGADGKTTLLHFVVQEIIRTEGARFSGPGEAPTGSADDAKCRRLGLEVVSALSSELSNVKKSAAMDSDVLSGDVSKLSRGIGDIRDVAARVGQERFSETVDGFVKSAEEEIIRIQAQESVALSLVKEITEYFHGNSAKEEAHPFRIFTVVRDFLSVLDRVCKEVGMINERTMVSSAHKFPVPVNPMLAQVLPVPKKPYSSSDEECLSP